MNKVYEEVEARLQYLNNHLELKEQDRPKLLDAVKEFFGDMDEDFYDMVADDLLRIGPVEYVNARVLGEIYLPQLGEYPIPKADFCRREIVIDVIGILQVFIEGNGNDEVESAYLNAFGNKWFCRWSYREWEMEHRIEPMQYGIKPYNDNTKQTEE